MYDLKIFDTLEELWKFLIKKNIIDYNFKRFDFDFMGETKSNYFLSFKTN